MSIGFTHLTRGHLNIQSQREIGQIERERDIEANGDKVSVLAEWSLLTPEVCSSNPDISDFYIEYLLLKRKLKEVVIVGHKMD